MANIKVVPQKLWEQMEEYIRHDNAILVPEDVLEKLPEATKKFILGEGKLEGYDFGCDADICLDFILDSDSYAAEQIQELFQEDE